MIRPISFCIPVTDTEVEYLELLLTSLEKSTQSNIHEVIVFVDSIQPEPIIDKLVERKNLFASFKIMTLGSGVPHTIGLQSNMSLMVQECRNNIFCHLQSDMVVSPGIDEVISRYLYDGEDDSNPLLKRVISLTRIEPPLHPPSPEKITHDFGKTPSEFNNLGWDAFVAFVENAKATKIATEGRKEMPDQFFSPFAMFKQSYIDIGGFDTGFLCSREDSDFIVRLHALKCELLQPLEAMVYHFTCVASRGLNWFNAESEDNPSNPSSIYQWADMAEVRRFIRKWGTFAHNIEYTSFSQLRIVLDSDVTPMVIDAILDIEPYFYDIQIEGPNSQFLAGFLVSTCRFNSEYYTAQKRKRSPNLMFSYDFRFTSIDPDRGKEYRPMLNSRLTLPVSVLKKVINSNHIRDFYEVISTLHLLPKTHESGVYDIQIVPNSEIPSVQLIILSTENRIPFIVDSASDSCYYFTIRKFSKTYMDLGDYVNVVLSPRFQELY